MNKKFLFSIFVVFACITAPLAYFKYTAVPPLPNPNDQSPEDIAKVMASADFSKLPAKVKDKYLENMTTQDKIREIFCRQA
mgnify:CR=1 FL=1